ncbi:inosine/xanthosine triphosphatase [Geoglobus ahangari]|uniref:Probable inosine/xanthosine triphosphatase n=1 Tax=Geoglobus ahangari TaxID=113653 RepID=A0A0F7IEN0_9EURY|nr:inosine/xanthosine triphosphatase [Geoglobus ahangari]AKG91117.1 inosine/xanthosine triphosphatase [Geoglobus ahangari]
MRVIVGSKNPAKVAGVKRAFSSFFGDVEVESTEAESGVGNQPFNGETILGAVNRARNAYRKGFDFSVGVEAGLFEFPHTLTGYVDFQVACVYDGERHTLGFGPGFEYPPQVVRDVLSGREVGEVMAELTGIENLGKRFGAIGFLTGKRVVRSDLTEIAVTMALIPWVNRDLYGIEP